MDVAFSSTFYPLSRAPMALQSIVYKLLYHCKNNHFHNKEDTTNNASFYTGVRTETGRSVDAVKVVQFSELELKV